MPEKVLVIELTHKHSHVAYPQCILLLEQGYDVTLLYWRRAFDPLLIHTLQDRVKLVEIDNSHSWRNLFSVWREHGFGDYDFAIFNTPEPNVRHLLFAATFPKQLQFIMHNSRPLSTIPIASLARKHRLLYRLLLRRASRIYVLSERIFAKRHANQPDWVTAKMSYFHPSFFPDFADPALPPLSDDGRIVFALPGRMWGGIRNYDSLLDALPRIAESPLRDRVQIRIMGSFWTDMGKQLLFKALELGLLGTVIRLQTEEYQPFDDYARELNGSHFLVPLIDSHPSFAVQYKDHVCPSAIMISRGFWLPLVVSSEFDLDEDVKPFAVEYQGDDLFDGIQQAVALYDSPRYATIRQQYREHMDKLLPESAANLRST